ncbi:hypothetical protein [Gimesia maris]|jgi:starvation-inducible outer membrane lipoprotein|uniref:Membrane or secreted protein n=1 Tax=Gimesia maris TaxID=122 RepID=A0ABX5YFU8_9PLAN|nr:hypothetical protein [Gimesia maris]EDL59082.1 hypothetical protein PM8797T_07659 [Gimesia maris DSM 8797]QDT76894.1 hypothetical protein Mal35_03180 [Gimesia maris]QEG14473.1 hypothetical protein GmarT_03080 [Gimesia maris]QGQ32102.1 hypothetical protein F1729_27610 [Gimesia maris]|tara:strand:- start:33090 stop:33299 length:210 start_codon:yes stop_codon:yes gene_type:complete
MKVLSKALIIVIIPSLSFFASGCEMLPHALQPSQWHKLNRGPAPRQDTYFSVPDHIPERDLNSHTESQD